MYMPLRNTCGRQMSVTLEENSFLALTQREEIAPGTHQLGAVLWEINIGSPVTGFPITYAVDGRQYVAVSTGTTGTTSAQIRLTPELRPSAGNNLFVFALPE